MKKKVLLTMLIEQDEDGIYIASIPSLKGCHTQAKTIEELYPRIKEAALAYLDEEDIEISVDEYEKMIR